MTYLHTVGLTLREKIIVMTVNQTALFKMQNLGTCKKYFSQPMDVSTYFRPFEAKKRKSKKNPLRGNFSIFHFSQKSFGRAYFPPSETKNENRKFEIFSKGPRKFP